MVDYVCYCSLTWPTFNENFALQQKWLPLHALAASGEFYLLNSLVKYDVDINAADQVRTTSAEILQFLLLWCPSIFISVNCDASL